MEDIINLPADFLKRLKIIFAPNIEKDIIKGFSQKRPTTFRVNTLLTTTKELTNKLTQLGIKYHSVDWCKDAFVLEGEKKELLATELYTNGQIYIQSLTSMLPPLILDPQPNDIILDQTAAPGSKTTQLAALMNNTGKILANDRHLIRLEKLKYNLKKQGVTNTEVKSLQGQEVGKRYPNTFDKTLLDAPCSLEGTFNLNNPKSYENWSEDLVKALSERQKDLLFSAYLATKVGGTIVYSTCTLSIEENEEVINWILKKLTGKIIIEPITLPVTLTPGFTGFHGKEFDPSLSKTVRILPSAIFEGFYLAKIKKLA